MDEATARSAVVAEARTWVGTPYHHAADVRGHGVDCAMLLVRIYCDLGLVERFDPRPYTQDWFLHRSEEKYLGFLFECAREVLEPDLGDVAVFRIGRLFAHAGVVSRTDPLTIIHAFAPARCVLEDIVAISELSAKLNMAKFASFWG
jgi:cell wall-associated NlpC family hydrolase